MEMELAVLPAKEKNYTYSQSQQISMQTGLIGHLRADMDSDGQGFFSTWFDFRKDLKTQEFKDEFDDVINALRSDEQYGGILASRFAMSKYCHAHAESAFEGNYTTEYGFRVNTRDHAYLLRLNPSKGDYNLYCYCYRRDWLDQHLKKAEKGIRFITSAYENKFRVADGDKVRITDKDGEFRDYTARYIDEYHVELSGPHGTNLYHICELAERLERNGTQSIVPLRASLPEQCYSMLLDTGKIVILKKGETGYYPTDIPFKDKEEAREIVNRQNEKLGVTRGQEEATKIGSMFGFEVPGADPAGYDKYGDFIKPKPKDRGDAR